MEKNERKEYLTAISTLAKDLTDESLQAVYELILICRNNEKIKKPLK